MKDYTELASQEESDLELRRVEVAEYNSKEWVYQIWRNQDTEEDYVSVLGELENTSEYCKNHRFEGDIEEHILEDDRVYKWSPSNTETEATVVSVHKYDEKDRPETAASIKALDKNGEDAEDLETILESNLNQDPV